MADENPLASADRVRSHPGRGAVDFFSRITRQAAQTGAIRSGNIWTNGPCPARNGGRERDLGLIYCRNGATVNNAA
ncbi:hypothetical protein [uncultured Bradyrhizobium sp.]|uniref:hypothetical protein n=1 Tax=uncultured Bradyrhizobium sp. TaxID=199684 RepID=UPI0035CA8D6C